MRICWNTINGGKLDIVNKTLVNMDFMNCCVENSVNDSTLVKIEDNEG